jgi:lambda family phage portal protein
MKKPTVSMNWIDRAVTAINPEAGLNRVKHKMALASMTDAGFIVPGSSKKEMRGVNVTLNSPDRDIIPKINGSRALARDMAMNTPLVTAAVRRFRTNVVGAGLQLQSKTNRQVLKSRLGITDEELDQWERDAESEFDLWANHGSKYCDFSGQCSFSEMQGLAAVTTFLSGDCFFMTPWKMPEKSGNWPYELRVKLIDPDLVRDPSSMGLGTIYSEAPGGVELKNGQVVAYHVASGYDWSTYDKDPVTFQRVEVRDRNGRQQMFHVVDRERIGQRRGMSWMAPVLSQLKQLSRLSDAELMSALVSSFFTVFIKDMSGLGGYLQQGFVPEDSINGAGGYGPEGEQVAPQQGSEWDLEMGHANVVYLDDKKEIQLADPKRSDASFAPFFNSLVVQVSAAIEIPAEELLLQFNSSYSAARAAILEAWKFWKGRRLWLAANFCQPIYSAFLEEAVVKNRLKCPGFFSDPLLRMAWEGSEWVGPGMGQIDPLKEAKAAVVKIQNNLTTHESEYMADTGGRWDDMINKRARENDILKEKGLLSNPVVTDVSGSDGTQQEEPDAAP